jgi:hypothetical protein
MMKTSPVKSKFIEIMLTFIIPSDASAEVMNKIAPNRTPVVF